MKPRNLLVKIVTIILFSLLILSFAVWGIGDIFRGTTAVSVAEVGETSIDQQAFARELSNEVANINRQFGGQLTGQQIQAFGLPQQVLSRMISQAILDEQARRMGLLVTQDQLRRGLQENPGFQDGSGRFDPNRVTLFLRQIGMSEQRYLELVSQDTLRSQLAGALTEAALAPDRLAEQLLSYRGERRVADFVAIEASRFDDLGEPEEAALQAIYENASSRYMRPSYKDITLVVLGVDEASRDIAVSDARVAEAFEERRDQYFEPERRQVSQALLPDEAAAQALAQRLTQGADFDAAVEEATGRAPVDLGNVTQDDLPDDLAGPVFALEAGKPSAPIQTSLGWHVVLVSEIEPAKEPVLEEHAAELRQELVTEEAVNIVIEQANTFDEELAAGASLEQAAQLVKQDVQSIPAIDSQARTPEGEVVQGLPPLADFLEVLNATSPGETSTLSESAEGDFFILRVNSVTPEEKRPFEEVRDQVVEQWRSEERARLAREMGEAMAASLNEGRAFTALAEAEGLTIEQTPPVTRLESGRNLSIDPRIPPQLFEVAEGEAASFALPESQVVIQLKEVLPPASETRDNRLAQIEQELGRSMQDDIFQQFLAALQQDFEVTVNQRLIDQVVAGF
jgi:peptidyl-prolyl cis-trans isomerase D